MWKKPPSLTMAPLLETVMSLSARSDSTGQDVPALAPQHVRRALQAEGGGQHQTAAHGHAKSAIRPRFSLEIPRIEQLVRHLGEIQFAGAPDRDHAVVFE